MFLAVCGCTDPADELPTSRPPPKSRRKSSSIAAARLSNADPEIAKKLEELNKLRRDSKSSVANAPIQKKYDDLESDLNKCKDDLRDLQRKSVIASPAHLRQKYADLGKQLKKCKDDLNVLHEEAQAADSESLQKKYEALQYVLMKYRKDIEDELQKCWTQLKLLHLESQFASATYDQRSRNGFSESCVEVCGEGGDEEEDEQGEDVARDDQEASEQETDAESDAVESLARIVPIALERNPRKPRCALLWKPPLPDPNPTKHYDERKLLSDLSCKKHRLGYRDKPPKY